MPYTDTTVNNLIVNVLSKSQYNALTPGNEEIYLITDDDFPAYETGDVIEVTSNLSTQVCIGYISNSSKDIYFNVCLPRPISASSVTVNNLTVRIRASAGGYIEQDVNLVGASGYTITPTINGLGVITINLGKSTAFTVNSATVTNNTPVMVELRSGTRFTFS